MHYHLPRGAFALSLLTCLLANSPVRAGDPVPAADPTRALAQSLLNLRMGAGIVADQVVLFPLYTIAEPASLDVSAGVNGPDLQFSEPEPKLGKVTVRAANTGAKPALVLAGTVLEGARRDRIVRFDRLIPANDATEIEVMPASMVQDTREKGKDFRMVDFLAPSYLRESVQFSPDTSVVPRFVSHFLEFRNPSDTRKSLVAIGGSDALADYCLACQRSFAEWPLRKESGTPIGAILVVRGRVQSIEIFATNEHLKTFLPSLLMSLAFPAAAIALRAKKMGAPLPGTEDPAGMVAASTKNSADLLASLGSATYARRKTDPSNLGEAWNIRLKDGTRGSALVRDGRLMHAAVYPGDPFEDALYSKPLTPLDPEDAEGGTGSGTDGGEGLVELARRAARGARLTPAEVRLLDRFRERLPTSR